MLNMPGVDAATPPPTLKKEYAATPPPTLLRPPHTLRRLAPPHTQPHPRVALGLKELVERRACAGARPGLRQELEGSQGVGAGAPGLALRVVHKPLLGGGNVLALRFEI